MITKLYTGIINGEFYYSLSLGLLLLEMRNDNINWLEKCEFPEVYVSCVQLQDGIVWKDSDNIEINIIWDFEKQEFILCES
jgi:hypothetical protein